MVLIPFMCVAVLPVPHGTSPGSARTTRVSSSVTWQMGLGMWGVQEPCSQESETFVDWVVTKCYQIFICFHASRKIEAVCIGCHVWHNWRLSVFWYEWCWFQLVGFYFLLCFTLSWLHSTGLGRFIGGEIHVIPSQPNVPSNPGDYFFRGVAKLRGLAKAKDLHQLPLAPKKLFHQTGKKQGLVTKLYAKFI